MNKVNLLLLSTCLFLCFSEDLKAQEEIFIPYRAGQFWGYADTSGNIVVTPIYNELFKQEHNMFLVKKEGKVGVVSLNNKVVIPFEEKNRISLTKNYILSRKTEHINGIPKTSKIYYSIISGKRTFPASISTITEIDLANKKYYKVQTKSGKQGLVKVSDKFEGIEKWYIDTTYVKIKSTWSLNYILIEKNGLTTKFSPGFTINEIDSLENINFLSEVPEEEIYEEIEDKPKAIWHNYSLLKLETNNTVQLIVQQSWEISKGKYQIMYDTLSSKFQEIKIFTSNTELNKRDSIDFHTNRKKQLSIAIVKGNNGKEGVVNSFGDLIVPIIYDSISNNILFEDCEEINLICYKNNKSGVINLQNIILIPFEFDELFRNIKNKRRTDKLALSCYRLIDGIIARKGNKHGVVNKKGEILAFRFDNIKYVKSTGSFQLQINNKYGILQSERTLYPKGSTQPPILINPIFNYPIDGIFEISGYLLGITLDHRSRINGYVDTKGFNYFKE